MVTTAVLHPGGNCFTILAPFTKPHIHFKSSGVIAATNKNICVYIITYTY
jgi:hypothetical protein